MPLILPGNVASATAATTYDVTNSCRFDGSSAYMSGTFGSPTNAKIWTFSFWFKGGSTGAHNAFISHVNADGKRAAVVKLLSGTGQLDLRGANTADSDAHTITTNRIFRDPAAWYHIVVGWDTTQSTAANRVKIYVNGTLETSFATSTYPDEDDTYMLNGNTFTFDVGRYADGSMYFPGYMAEVCWIDGTQYAASDFGEFDSDSPTIWKPKDVSGLTFGNNGFYLDFEDSGNLGDDESGNADDLSETNIAAADQATDTPTNNFATMNPLENYYPAGNFSEGNCKVVTPGTAVYTPNTSTFGMSAGKWYAEVKLVSGTDHIIGITDYVGLWTGNQQELGDFPNEWGYYGSTPAKYRNDSSYTEWGNVIAANDVIGIALDLDNSKLYFSIDGTWQESGDPAAGSNGISITAVGSTSHGEYFFGSTGWANAAETFAWNFGGCSAFDVSSGNADDNGYGNFEYDVPAGYLALCTKNLGSDGG